MNEQDFAIYRVSDEEERREMKKSIDTKLKNGWKIIHLAGAGGRSNSTAPSYAVVFEKLSPNPQIQ